jgi:beta-phosphoglucomutase
MDGVIVDGMRYHVPAWQAAFRRFLNVDVPGYRIRVGEGVKGRALVDQITVELGVTLSDDEKADLYSFKRKLFRDTFRIEPIPGIGDLVNTIKLLGHSLALVTGTGRDVADDVLAHLGFEPLFDCIVSGDDVTEGKPSPEPYLLAVETLGVARECCLVIENAPAGIASARAAGLTCVAVEMSLDAEHLAGADRLVSNHAEIQQILLAEQSVSEGRGPWRF